MPLHNGMKFTTLDSDNDVSPKNCAVVYWGAWWYKNCFLSNLNAHYYNKSSTPLYATGVMWYTFRGYYESLKSCKMLITKK